MHVFGTRMPRIPPNCAETNNTHQKIGLGAQNQPPKALDVTHVLDVCGFY